MKHLIIVLLILFIGCSNNSQIEISSDTYWEGTVGKIEVSGNGNSYIELPEEKVLIVLKKSTQQGYLEVSLTNSSIVEPKETYMTRNPFGEVKLWSK